MADSLEIYKTTGNIYQAVEDFAQEHFLPLAECDFKILKTITYVKSSSTGEFRHYSKEVTKEYMDKDRILNEHIEFTQQYQLVISQLEECKLKLNYTLELDAHLTHPKIILFPDSIIPYKLYKPQELLILLYNECNKIKAYNKLLTRIFDEKMVTNLKVLIKYIYAGKFTKKVKLSLFEGIDPLITRKGKLIYWFKEREAQGKHQVLEVDTGELLIEYKKPIFGKGGFNASGKIITTDYVTNENDLEAEIDSESIVIKEDTNSKQYLAKKQGYIHFNEKYLSVNNKINLHDISRNALSIASEEENNIEVTVSQYDTNRDSVGEGVSIKSEAIHIDGFVGAKSVLEAVKLSIDGATHQNSKQFAKSAQINRHKGMLRCQHAKIALLEGGEVHATTVEIESSLGGSIYAQDVIIGHVKNNLKVYASNSIKIKLMSGEDNLLAIGTNNIPILQSKIAFIEQDIGDLKYHLEEATRHKPEEVKNIQKKIEALKDERYVIEHSYEDATVHIEQPLRGLNNIVFTVDDSNSISYKTEEKSYSKFYLELEENKITLQPVNKSITLEK